MTEPIDLLASYDERRLLDRLTALQPSRLTLATLLRVARRISEGFEGEIQLTITRHGVRSLRWVQLENGDMIKEELG